MNIVVAGGSGFIGTNLVESLLGEGHTVIVVDTVPPARTHPSLFFIQSDVANQPLPYNILERTDAVINLVGVPFIQKWTPEVMAQIKESRINSTRHIVESIALTKSRPGVFICASTTGFYEESLLEHDEQGQNGNDFLASIAGEWEAEAREAAQYGLRVVCIRNALVLGNGGLLAVLQRGPFGTIVPLTKKDIHLSWIHVDDLVNVYKFALETTTLQGIVNATAPLPTTMNELLLTLKTLTKRPIIRLPERFLQAQYKSFTTLFFKNALIVPKRLLDKGFVFMLPTLTEAVAASLIDQK